MDDFELRFVYLFICLGKSLLKLRLTLNLPFFSKVLGIQACSLFGIKLNASCLLNKQVLYQFTTFLVLISFFKKMLHYTQKYKYSEKECWLQVCGNSKMSLNIYYIRVKNLWSDIIQLNNSWNINGQKNTLVPYNTASSQTDKVFFPCGKEMLLW